MEHEIDAMDVMECTKENTKRNGSTYRRPAAKGRWLQKGHNFFETRNRNVHDSQRRKHRSTRNTMQAGLHRQVQGYDVAPPILLGEIDCSSERDGRSGKFVKAKSTHCKFESKMMIERFLALPPDKRQYSYFLEHFLLEEEFKMERPMEFGSLHGYQTQSPACYEYLFPSGEEVDDVEDVEWDITDHIIGGVLHDRCRRRQLRKLISNLAHDKNGEPVVRDPIPIPWTAWSKFQLAKDYHKWAMTDYTSVLGSFSPQLLPQIFSIKRQKPTKSQWSKRHLAVHPFVVRQRIDRRIVSSSDSKIHHKRSGFVLDGASDASKLNVSNVPTKSGCSLDHPHSIKARNAAIRNSAKFRHTTIHQPNKIRGVRRGTVELDYDYTVVE